MNLVVWAVAVLALLGVLILVHELGHFLCAKAFDVKVLRFSLGFGPRLFGLTWGSADHHEAVRAFFEKRPPRWGGT